MSLTRAAEYRDITQWEPTDGEAVPVQVMYLGRKALLHVDRVTVTRARYESPSTPSRTTVDVQFRTRPNSARFGMWTWHSQDEPGERRILGEITDMQVWSLLKAEAPEAIQS